MDTNDRSKIGDVFNSFKPEVSIYANDRPEVGILESNLFKSEVGTAQANHRPEVGNVFSIFKPEVGAHANGNTYEVGNVLNTFKLEVGVDTNNRLDLN